MCTSLPSLGWTVFFPHHLNLHLTPSRPLHPATPHSDLCGSEDVFLEEKDRDKCLKRALYISKDRKVKPKHFVNIKLQYSYVRNKHGCGDQNLFWGLIGPPVTQSHTCFPLLLRLLCICNSRRCCSPHFLNSLINKTAITVSCYFVPKVFGNTLSVSLPFRKQCQAVEGQEWDHPRSSSSDRDDMQKMPDSDSLLACKTHIKQPQMYVLYAIYSSTLSQGLKLTVNKITAPCGR